MQISTQIQLNASPSDVWRELIDFDSYSAWNPFMKSIKGKAKLNEKLEIQIEANGKSHTFRARLIEVSENKKLAWKGGLANQHWLFSGLHSFELKALPNEQTLLIHSECFSGLLARLIFQSIHADTTQGFIDMNKALEKRLLVFRRDKASLAS